MQALLLVSFFGGKFFLKSFNDFSSVFWLNVNNAVVAVNAGLAVFFCPRVLPRRSALLIFQVHRIDAMAASAKPGVISLELSPD
jgi:hypothetical protein